MKNRPGAFNLILAALVAGLLGGCETTKVGKKGKEDYATLRLHLEVNQDDTNWVRPIQVYRENPQTIHVHTIPFLDERNVLEAAVLDDIREIDGERVNLGKAVGIRFDRTGKWLLENTTVSNRGRRIAIHSFFPEGRWLAAKVITGRIQDGIFIFTPDATEEEMGQLCERLNAVAKKLETAKYW